VEGDALNKPCSDENGYGFNQTQLLSLLFLTSENYFTRFCNSSVCVWFCVLLSLFFSILRGQREK